MAYRLENGESVRDGVIRSAAEQLDRAVSELSERIAQDAADAVHSARKAVKKERSLLRLVRGSMPAQQRRRENRALRDAARALSATRDAAAMIDTLDQLAARYAGQLPQRTFAELRAELQHAADRQPAPLVGPAVDPEAVAQLEAVKARVADWRVTKAGFEAVEDGLLRSYAEGRAAFRRARSQRSVERWHAWRKRAKDLWYQERLLAAVAGPAVAGHAKDAHLLADLLGDDHDLAVLRKALTEGKALAPVDIDAVASLIDHRRGELQTEALWIGARVYAEKPKAFIRRMRRTWMAGRGPARAAAAQDPSTLADATRATPAHH